MIYLLTGQPGHGKTLRGLELALKFKEEGRLVYAHGTPGLDHAKTGFLELEDPKLWESLPDNSVIFIDECYTVFPNRAANSAAPPHVEPLARHRHRGFDFVLVCQLGNQIDPFLRGLVDQHTHVRRKFGFNVAVLKTWDHYESNVLKQDASNQTWRHPKAIKKGNYYRSTTQDTTKRRLPWYFLVAPLLLGYVGYVFWQISTGSLFGDDASASPTAQEAAVSGSTGASAPGAPDAAAEEVMTVEQYVAKYTPRIASMPWSTPALDGREAVSEPMVYCMSSEDSCTCMTEQGTIHLVPPKDCRHNARYGPVYNPFLRPNSGEVESETRTDSPGAVASFTGPRPGYEPDVGEPLRPINGGVISAVGSVGSPADGAP